MSNITSERLIQALQILEAQNVTTPQAVYKHTTPSGTPSLPYYTGPGGLFGVSQLPEREVLSTRVQAQGLVGYLPWRGTRKMFPLFPYLTGFRATTGSNPSGVCDDGKTAGPGKSAYQTAQFGRYTFMTREMEINRAGQQIDRGENFDYILVNDPLRDADIINALANSGLFRGLPPADSLVNGREMLARMIEVGVAFQNQLVAQLWTGNPANNAAAGGYKEFPGLEILIGTNKVDALTNTDVPALDSIVRNFNYAKVTNLTSSGDIVNEVTYIARILKSNASRMGYNPVKWVIAMRESLFYELTKVWPCSYLTYSCAFRTSDGTVIQNVSAADQVAMRDTMRNGRYLLIDGEKWDVVFDDGIVEESSAQTSSISATCFASDIYFIPLTVKGNFAVTYMEYLDYAGPAGALQAASDGHYINDFWSDGGVYLWHAKPPKNWCVQLIAKMEPRLIFRAPFLAARLNNVQYCPLMHERDPFPDGNYFANGGVSTPRAAPSYYSDWNL